MYEPLESGGWPRGRPFDVLADHVVFEMESIDRMSLNVYVPGLQYPARLLVMSTAVRAADRLDRAAGVDQ